MSLKINDIVKNEYNNIGSIKEINNDEVIVLVINSTLKDDYDYCNIDLCRLATDEEIVAAFEV